MKVVPVLCSSLPRYCLLSVAIFAGAVGALNAADKNEALPVPEINTGAGDYQLAPRDFVQFQICEEPDTLTLQRVSTTGEISVPMLGNVKVGGHTLQGAEEMLAKAYVQGGFFVKAQVILSVQTYAPRNVSVLGQVNHPEQIDMPVERDVINLVQAITLAGGFTRVAKTDGIRVIRSVDGKEQQFTVNVTDYLDSKNSNQFMLRPDDIVYVPERVF